MDGASHGFGDRPQRDERRDGWLRAQGVEVVRLSARYVLEDPGRASEWIVQLARERGG